MTDDFLTKGLQNDRYLKALRLIEQFEAEIEAILLEFDQRMVDEHPGLFESNSGSTNTNRSPSNGLAFQRVNHSMKGPRAPDDDGTQKLNVHLYWMPPTKYARTNIDGAVRGFGYKIKGADQSIDKRVVEQTRDQYESIETSGNPYDSNTVFYRHVSSFKDIKETRETLVSHFSEFGGEYARNEDEYP